ncbi:MAG: hypothetical protein FJX47_15455 [Alphaproteobacteria bacterium]|nr:hypothetical protein [Alphaproteobacteria bacterium]
MVLAGIVDLGFGVFHLLFWRLFAWRSRLANAGTVNAAVTQTLNIVLIYVFLVYGGGLIGLAVSSEPPPTSLLLAGAGFWALRLPLQFMLFSMKHPASWTVTGAIALALALHAGAAFVP